MRAARYAALGDPVRLAIVDELTLSDRAPIELRRLLGIESNLLAHHLDVLETVGMIDRSRSSGDGAAATCTSFAASFEISHRFSGFGPTGRCSCAPPTRRAVSWPRRCGGRWPVRRPSRPAPTRPIGCTPERSPRRAGRARPRRIGPQTLDEVADRPRHRGHRLRPGPRGARSPDDTWLHWSVPDPVIVGTRIGVRRALAELRDRITALLGDTRAAA